MLNYIEYLDEHLDIPASGFVIALVGLFFILQLVGEFLEKTGKIVPEFLKLRKYFKRKKEERESLRRVPETLKKVEALLHTVDSHYSADNITKRDNWMGWVNHQAGVYDTSIAELKATMVKLLIDNKRNYLLDFTSKAVDISYPMSKEQYQRFYNVYEEYEEILKDNDMTNGQVEVAYEVANKSFEERLKRHAFIEDMRDYSE